MPVKVKVKGVGKVEDEIRSIYSKVLKDKRMQSDLKEFVERTNKADMSRGINSKGKPFKALETPTVNSRRSRSRYNQTSDLFKAGKSNLHFSGQLKNSIFGSIKSNTTKLAISLNLKDPRKPYKNKDGTNAKGSITNSELYQQVLKISKKFDFLGVFFTPKRRTQVKNIIRAAIRRRL